ncbi:hypothetical protein HZA87_05305 [Candidatus Uhrbacteria bacterium]|nr:hypothetical protein [Candidatus Uhrbacteria bacterium]
MYFVVSAAAAAILLYVLFQSIRSFLLVRKSLKLVGVSRRFERDIPDAKLRILVIGDSTGVGTGSEPQFSIAGRLASDFPDASIQNESVNGWKVADALRNLPDVPAKSFDIILLQIGANDIMRGTPLPGFSAALDSLFKKSTAAGKRVFALHSGNIGLAPFFPWPLSVLMRLRTLRYRSEYRRIAEANGVTYVDLYHEAVDDPFQGKHEFYAPDLLHLSAKGYGEWYRSVKIL